MPPLPGAACKTLVQMLLHTSESCMCVAFMCGIYCRLKAAFDVYAVLCKSSSAVSVVLSGNYKTAVMSSSEINEV